MPVKDTRTHPATVWIYDGAEPEEADAEDLAAFLRERLPSARVEVRRDFLWHFLEGRGAAVERHSLAAQIARARVRRPEERVTSREPLPGEVAYELKFLMAGPEKPAGILYDGQLLAAALARLLDPDEVDRSVCHAALTNQLIGTWDGANGRYHARVAVFGFPTLISIPGLVEGPARPREHYLQRGLGLPESQGTEETEAPYLQRGDPRIREALKGYLLQAVFYQAVGDPFCESADCRLYNAHWQEELIRAQTGPEAGLCPRHRRMLEEMSCS